MEVHHHPHLPHEKKKFREYFLEFLMLFLAVTLGFLAENLRENMGDSEKEKGYIESLINNLEDDKVSLKSTIKENEDKLHKLEAFITIPIADFLDTTKRREIYEKEISSIGFYSEFKSNDATMEQLKSGGNLHLIKKGHVADSIANYDNQLKIVYAAENLYVNATQIAILANEEVFDYTIYYDTTYLKNHAFTGKTLPLLTRDAGKIKLMMNRVDYEIGATRNYINNMQERLPVAERLIAYLKHEYNIEN